ncbi:response regulator [Chlorogloeopsis sp. ULAP01]|uniref:response regulator n=1 Tax=Chlorogloeopsis sp. ULAP01 TaxID=3056483 RepID=UPI0025AB40FB|nr:response regulator [Chlorogloeopsis sp. ULAP01]MDM9381833.1 response regulator [Chlorogloeopsis sp. ULAP01]
MCGIGAKQNSDHHYILICDDVPENCFFLETVLKLEGYDVEIVNSGTAALAKVEASQPALLLLDLMMPDIDGYEVARRIQQNPTLESLPIVLITAYEEALINEECEVRLAGIIRKPIDPDELLNQVQAILMSKN